MTPSLLRQVKVIFFRNDVKLYRTLKTSLLNEIGILNIPKKFTKKLIIIKIKPCNATIIERVLNIKVLGGFPVICRLPLNQSESIGVIGPIGLDTNLKEMKDDLCLDYPNIMNIDRITKSKGKIRSPTLSVKIMFNSEKLPDYLTFGFQRFKVSTFVSSPWQCYRCQGFGHSSKECRYKVKCLVCSGEHEFKNYPQKILM